MRAAILGAILPNVLPTNAAAGNAAHAVQFQDASVQLLLDTSRIVVANELASDELLSFGVSMAAVRDRE